MGKILLIGSLGQLGQELTTTLAPFGILQGVSRQEIDLSQASAITEMILALRPNIIVNAAAYTAVDKAESEPELAQQVNGVAPQVMAKTAAEIGAKFLHVSTDYVFNGQKNTPYLETDLTEALGVYGASKLAGEEGIKEVNSTAIILRTAWVYGAFGKGNFVKTMLRLGKERDQLKVVTDQVGSPTWAYDIAVAIAELLNIPDAQGIYNFTNTGVISWYDFAQAIFHEARLLGFPLQIQEVIPITTAEYPTPAKRPAYSALSTKKIAETLGHYPPYWRDSLVKMLQQLYTKTL